MPLHAVARRPVSASHWSLDYEISTKKLLKKKRVLIVVFDHNEKVFRYLYRVSDDVILIYRYRVMYTLKIKEA